MIKLLLDQGIPYSTARLLTDIGWDVKHVTDIGMQQASDQSILDRAHTESRICITLDADFHMLLAISNANSPSVIRIRQEGLKAADVASMLRRVWPMIEAKIKKGAMISINGKSIRVRYLPLVANNDH